MSFLIDHGAVSGTIHQWISVPQFLERLLHRSSEPASSSNKPRQSGELFGRASSFRMHHSISSLVDVQSFVVYFIQTSKLSKFCQQWPFHAASLEASATDKDRTTITGISTTPVSTSSESNDKSRELSENFSVSPTGKQVRFFAVSCPAPRCRDHWDFCDALATALMT